MFESVKEIFQPTEEQMERFTKAFISRLPKYMQEAISPSLAAYIEYLLAKLLSFQGFIVLFGVGSLSYNINEKRLLT
ncbi:hypothetical protein BTI62_06140 [Lactobacillus delbrueckii subsp. bulgaricus]|nr:hypothetical protein [Lactobacillus delbrueckii subsp. bulgaricus]MBT8923198.1 hypothetical protein [Lactobacillus delbrueckii subsp. bulgaricus]